MARGRDTEHHASHKNFQNSEIEITTPGEQLSSCALAPFSNRDPIQERTSFIS